MLRAAGRGAGRLQRLAVEPAFQHRLHTLIGAGAGGHGTRRRRFQPLVRIALAQPQNPQTRPVAHLRVRLTFQDGLEQLRRGRSHRLRPMQQARGRPSQVLLMALGSMLVDGRGFIGLAAAGMRSHALAAVEDLHRGQRRADLHHLPGQHVGHAVVVEVDLDVIVDVDARRRPLLELKAFARQRPQRGPVQLLEQAGATARALAKGPLVELIEQLADRLVEFGQTEELPMPQRRHDPTLHDLHAGFDLGLVAGLVRPRGQHAHAVVHGQFVIGAVQIGLVAAGAIHAGAGIVGDDQLGDAAQKFEGADVRADPVL